MKKTINGISGNQRNPRSRKIIFVSGSLVYDRIMDFPGYFKDYIMPEKIHILNVSFMVNGVKESFGGTAGNIAYNLSLLGERPSILACAGNDFAPYKKWLLKNKVNVSFIKEIKDKQTSSCYITTDKADNQITAFNPGALVCESFRRGRASTKEARPLRKLAIIAPGNNKDMENYAAFYKKAKIKYIFDPGQQITVLSSLVLKKCISGAEVLIGNDYEINLIMKNIGWTLKNILDKVEILIITKGGKGSVIYNKRKRHNIPAVKLKKVVDPTGAGDAYRAGLAKGMIENWPIEKSAKLASVVASFAVERAGTQEHRFSWREVEKRYRDCYKENLELRILNFEF